MDLTPFIEKEGGEKFLAQWDQKALETCKYKGKIYAVPQDSEIRHNWGWYLCNTGKPKEAIVEAMIFASPEPLTAKALFKLLDSEPKEDVDAALATLAPEFRAAVVLRLQTLAHAEGYWLDTGTLKTV